MNKYAIVIIVFLISAPGANSQCKYYNKVDKNGKKTGIWFSYWDASEKKLHRKFHYKNDREVKVCKMYHRNGKLITKERHLKNRIKVKNYDEKGRIHRKGWAKIDFNAKDLHFYWHGRWKFYDHKHHLTGISIYKNGYFIENKKNNRTKNNNNE